MNAVTGLSSIKPDATSGGPDRAALERQKVGELAQEFESMMLLQMLRQMRQSMMDGQDGEDGERGLYADTMTDTVDGELARQLSKAGGVGIADSLQRALEQRAKSVPAGSAVQGLTPAPPIPLQPVTAPNLHTHEFMALASGQLMPTTSPFGWRSDPFTGETKYHAGVDLGAAYGTAVPAVAGGRIVEAGTEGAYGNTVVIEHEPGLQTRYAHLSAIEVAVGDRVESGREIGRVGQSGRATGPHLHFEVIRNGQRVDPAGILALGELGSDGLKSTGQNADSPVGGGVVNASTTGADDEDRGH